MPNLYDGAWTGTTSQGKEFSFGVGANVIRSYKFGYAYQGNNCSVDGTVTAERAFESITGNTFSWTDTFPDGSSYTVTGTFSSSTSASGTVRGTNQHPRCSGSFDATWSATKQ